jgi:MFS family permease
MTTNGATHDAASLSPFGTGVPGARKALALLLAINLFNYLDRYILNALLKPIETDLLPENGPTNGTLLGLLVPAFMVAYMLFAPVFGWLADRMSRWVLIAIGVIVWTLASGASGLPGSYVRWFADTGLRDAVFFGAGWLFWLLVLTRCLVGIGEAAYGPAAPALISDLYPVKVRGQVLSLFYAAIPVGGALGYVWGGAIGWPDAFYWVIPPGLLLGIACLMMRDPPRGQTDVQDPSRVSGHLPASPRNQVRGQTEVQNPFRVRRAGLKDYLWLLRNRSYVLATLGYTAATFAVGGIAAWMPYYLEDYRGEPRDQANYYFGIITVVAGLTATILGGIAGDRLRGRFPGSYFLVSAGGMLVGFPLFLAVLVTPLPWAWVLIFLACFCLFFNTGPVNTILANVTHPALRAPGFALNILIIHAFGDAISPLVIGAIADWLHDGTRKNLNAGFLAVSGMILLSAAFWCAGAPFLARDTELAPTSLPD